MNLPLPTVRGNSSSGLQHAQGSDQLERRLMSPYISNARPRGTITVVLLPNDPALAVFLNILFGVFHICHELLDMGPFPMGIRLKSNK